MDRRQFLALGATAGIGGLAGCTLSNAVESQTNNGPTVTLEPVAEGITSPLAEGEPGYPVGMTFLPDGSRLVIGRTGWVRRHTADGFDDGLVLNLADELPPIKGERGLLGIALHPEFESNNRFYLRYSSPAVEPDESHRAVLAEFRTTTDFTGVVPGSEREILSISQPGPVHNAGSLAFDGDGNLFVGLGDGQRTDLGEDNGLWWYQQGGAAQNLTDNLRGGILRIDVDTPEGDRAYSVPSDNPLVGEEGRDEYYAWGLRNPYRISVDRGQLYIGDVGEFIREAVYLGEPGANYGWPMIEGSSCGASTSVGHSISDNPLNILNPKTWVAQTNRVSPTKVCPETEAAKGEIVQPVVEYNRPGSRFVTGGYVYRGDELPSLSGRYLFGDGIPPAPLFALNEPESDNRPWPVDELDIAGSSSGRLNEQILSFARDPEGEMYLLSTAVSGGNIRQITAAE
jgi:glucose/arabinose dehydrogenase